MGVSISISQENRKSLSSVHAEEVLRLQNLPHSDRLAPPSRNHHLSQRTRQSKIYNDFNQLHRNPPICTSLQSISNLIHKRATSLTKRTVIEMFGAAEPGDDFVAKANAATFRAISSAAPDTVQFDQPVTYQFYLEPILRNKGSIHNIRGLDRVCMRGIISYFTKKTSDGCGDDDTRMGVACWCITVEAFCEEWVYVLPLPPPSYGTVTSADDEPPEAPDTAEKKKKKGRARKIAKGIGRFVGVVVRAAVCL